MTAIDLEKGAGKESPASNVDGATKPKSKSSPSKKTSAYLTLGLILRTIAALVAMVMMFGAFLLGTVCMATDDYEACGTRVAAQAMVSMSVLVGFASICGVITRYVAT